MGKSDARRFSNFCVAALSLYENVAVLNSAYELLRTSCLVKC